MQSVNSRKLISLTICSIAVVFLVAGYFVIYTVRADNNRVFELRVYHVLPGKMPALEARFRDKTSKILARHNLNVVGYWVTEDASENSFIFMVAHSSREEA